MDSSSTTYIRDRPLEITGISLLVLSETQLLLSTRQRASCPDHQHTGVQRSQISYSPSSSSALSQGRGDCAWTVCGSLCVAWLPTRAPLISRPPFQMAHRAGLPPTQVRVHGGSSTVKHVFSVACVPSEDAD